MDVIRGTEASPGLCIAPIARWTRTDLLPVRSVGDVEEELAVALTSIKEAGRQLKRLALEVGGEGADILEFQIALLDDLAAPVTARVEAGTSAHGALAEVLDAEIDAFLEDGDEVLAGRVSDLRDLRGRLLRNAAGGGETGPAEAGGKPVVLVVDDIVPSDFLALERSTVAGVALAQGSLTSHVAILAKARGVPMLVGCGRELLDVEQGRLAVLDSANGSLIVEPDVETAAAARRRLEKSTKALEEARSRINQPAFLRSGERVTVNANVDDVSLLGSIDVEPFDGVGLVRTEFMFRDDHLPDEDEQFRTYGSIIGWAAGRPVTFRTLDAGGDKPIKGLIVAEEANPFLGIRGYRLSRANPDVFRVQLRALARAAALGPMSIMIPMVTQPEEMTEFRGLFAEVCAELAGQQVAHAAPPLGIMVEVPAAALSATRFDADFLSIGSNDLIQYTLAKARDNAALGYISDGHPAVRTLIGMTVFAARARGVPLSVCGDMASTADGVCTLLELGVRSLSVAPAQVTLVKETIRQWNGQSDG